jgi:hypothetical protein
MLASREHHVTVLAELTFMVNNPRLRLLSAVDCALTSHKDRTLIENGPVYCLKTVQAGLSLDTLFVLNDKANSDMALKFSPKLLDEHLIPFILALTHTDHVGSERCATSIRKTIDCDAYSMPWNRYSQKRWSDAQSIYIKFGFIDNNPRLLVISIHP